MLTNQITRRAAFAAGVAVFGQTRPGRVRFGVRTPFPKTMSLRDRARLVRQLGYDGIELGPEWLNQNTDSIRQELEGTGVAVSAIVGSLKLLDADPQKRAGAVELDRLRLGMARELGANCLIEVPIFGPARPMIPRALEDEWLVAGLQQLAEDVKRTGITVLLEPLTRKETHFMNLQSEGVNTIHSVGAPGFKLLSDFYHMQLEEKDIGETLARGGKYTGYVHLADGEQRTEPGSLPFDYRPGFRALKKWGYSGWLTVESKATDDPQAALARALKYLQSQWHEA